MSRSPAPYMIWTMSLYGEVRFWMMVLASSLERTVGTRLLRLGRMKPRSVWSSSMWRTLR